MRKLTPNKNKHFKNINTGDIYEGVIYLGIYDSAINYVEVSEEEYQAYLKTQEVIEDNGATT
jgi:hypothetical protein